MKTLRVITDDARLASAAHRAKRDAAGRVPVETVKARYMAEARECVRIAMSDA